ncbi:MAG: hypothetical protein IJ853_04285 [Rickettsiales bacterium]|nr:hypothetical protein [Rickettsiales bacterium]
MKNTASIITLAILSLFVGFFFGERSNIQQTKDIVHCGYNQDYLKDTYTDWINEALIKADKYAEKNPIKVVGVRRVVEYNTIPEFMEVKLYEDFKDSKVCQASLLVNYTPDGEKETLEEITVRFQKIATVPNEEGLILNDIRSSGYDVKEMSEQAVEFFKKHNDGKK